MDPTAIFYFLNIKKKERLLRPLEKKRGIHSVHTFIRQIVKSKNMVTWTQLEKKRTTGKPEQRYRPGWPVGLLALSDGKHERDGRGRCWTAIKLGKIEAPE